ncbi:hypothetical protein BGW36DRAFT_396734 [Talaromyces proteolyticus]|uniref:Transcription initiation factor TFIID subunit 4 n=1 Tax=Talaromyces proteolyticus TaxID=1131652 RepID=A0AAD4KS64_9EURO|nr:uncharacterized protein BGW36DRAFT_396734 [Talaromyces proteolyticus]KAH8699170.1 hypothetical protein BGW36DRAFT_396734 [Talaromyces proteolyticus]
MAQTQPPHPSQYPSQSFSPPVSTPSPSATSPANVGSIPPSKRQRFSPLPQSQPPYESPSFGTLQLPQNPSPVMNGTNMNGVSTPGPVQTPVLAPVPGASPTPIVPAPLGTMGPPSRPAEKPTDAADLTDVLAQSGIDVKEEEAYLTQSYSAPQAAPRSQPPGLNTSFVSNPSTPGTTSAGASFDMSQSRITPTQEQQVYPPYSEDAPYNQPTYEETRAARRAQYHLQEPFLFTKVLEQKIQKRGFELGVRVPTEGLFHPMPGSRQPIEVTGPDGSSTVRRGHTIVNQEGAPFVDIISLMSLCCEERLRGVIEYSASLAKSRRAHSHGIVPVEWKDLAATDSNPVVTEATLKRPRAGTETSNSNPIAEKYFALSTKDISDEEARAAKRAKRNADAIINETATSRAPSLDVGSGAVTPTPQTPIGGDKKALTKKEAKKQLDARVSEAQQHQQSVETARKALSSTLFGSSKKRQYSWLNKGSAASAASSPRPHSPAIGPAGSDRNEKTRNDSVAAPISTQLGSWREDKAAGIQVRDILFVLEQDGRGARHVQKAYSKDLKEERLD